MHTGHISISHLKKNLLIKIPLKPFVFYLFYSIYINLCFDHSPVQYGSKAINENISTVWPE